MFARSSPRTLFPIYLVPSSPFRRRKKSTDAADSTNGTIGSYLSNHTSYLRCAKCAVDICSTSQIISKGFTGRHGRAYLVSPPVLPTGTSQPCNANRNSCLPNTRTDPPSSRQLVTGAHTVSDVHCAFCGSLLGWKYEEAEEESQRYKVGKYILETKMICSSSNWETGDLEVAPVSLQIKKLRDAGGEAATEFDSQDEDECEDLFAGIWSPSLAVKRRQGRSFRRAMPGNMSQTNSTQ